MGKKPNRRPNQICEICGIPFYTRPIHIRNGRGRFCSIKCATESRRNSWLKTCEYCGEEFQVTPATQDKCFCSIKCWGLQKTKKALLVRTCELCGKEFESPLSKVEVGCGKFCSRTCSDQAARTGRLATCAVCEKEFWITPAKEKKGEGKYCSHECLGRAKKGVNNHFWNGGISFELYGIEFDDNLRLVIRTRDEFKCRICGVSEGRKAHCVHHIDYNKQNNNSMNLITLCGSCHPRTNSNRAYWQNHFEKLLAEVIIIEKAK